MSDNDIKIMSTMKFDLDDLIKIVEFSHPFTLRDVLLACKNSEIPIRVLESILHCRYIEEFCKEAESKPFSDNGEIEYLEVYWWGSKRTYDGIIEHYNSWEFHGVGDSNQVYGIEFSPMYNLADYEIKKSPKLHITDYDLSPNEEGSLHIDYDPSITLIELLKSIFWELSYYGSPEERNKKMEELLETIKETDKINLSEEK